MVIDIGLCGVSLYSCSEIIYDKVVALMQWFRTIVAECMHDCLTRLVLIRIFLLAFCTSLEGQTTVNLTVYATSAFYEFPLVATVYVVAGVVNGTHPLLNGVGAG